MSENCVRQFVLGVVLQGVCCVARGIVWGAGQGLVFFANSGMCRKFGDCVLAHGIPASLKESFGRVERSMMKGSDASPTAYDGNGIVVAPL